MLGGGRLRPAAVLLGGGAGAARAARAARHAAAAGEVAREAKEHLTAHGEAPITAKLSSGEFVDLAIDTETFCSITQTLVNKTFGPMRKALRDAFTPTK